MSVQYGRLGKYAIVCLTAALIPHKKAQPLNMTLVTVTAIASPQRPALLKLPAFPLLLALVMTVHGCSCCPLAQHFLVTG